MKPYLEVQHVSYSYHSLSGEIPVFEDLNFSVEQGEFLVITGPSGCGKTTLLSLLAGFLKPESGQILLKGKPIAGQRSSIGYMLQRDYLLEWRSIYRNITLGPEIARSKKLHRNFLCTPGISKISQQYQSEISHLLQEYGLFEFSNAYPDQLSGGMRQRTALIRTMILSPELLLLDEPFSALDYQTRLLVSNDIYQILKKKHQTTLLITHDLSEAVSMGDRILLLTRRPAKICKSIEPRFETEKRSVLSVRNTPEFKTYFQMLWEGVANESE